MGVKTTLKDIFVKGPNRGGALPLQDQGVVLINPNNPSEAGQWTCLIGICPVCPGNLHLCTQTCRTMSGFVRVSVQLVKLVNAAAES